MGGRNVKNCSMFVVIFQDVRQAAWQRRLLIRRGSRVSVPHPPAENSPKSRAAFEERIFPRQI